MTKALGLIPLALVLATPLVLAAPADDMPLVKTELAQLATQAKCSDAASPWRVWCVATQWDAGVAAPLPKGKKLVGIAVAIETGKETEALKDHVTLAALSVGDDGLVKLTDITPDNPDEAKQILEGVMNVSLVMKGKAAKAKLPPPLADYIRTRTPSYTPERKGNAWVWQGASSARMRKIGAYWVVLEVPDAKNGIWATILTDAWE
ncbi:MAG TPA: hypothetical protein VGM88_11165 [Kofleriaceae bacterium]|jgi:hypothetical protein